MPLLRDLKASIINIAEANVAIVKLSAMLIGLGARLVDDGLTGEGLVDEGLVEGLTEPKIMATLCVLCVYVKWISQE